jgi:hypothetical protein
MRSNADWARLPIEGEEESDDDSDEGGAVSGSEEGASRDGGVEGDDMNPCRAAGKRVVGETIGAPSKGCNRWRYAGFGDSLFVIR